MPSQTAAIPLQTDVVCRLRDPPPSWLWNDAEAATGIIILIRASNGYEPRFYNHFAMDFSIISSGRRLSKTSQEAHFSFECYLSLDWNQDNKMLIGDIYEKDELCTYVQKGKIVKKRHVGKRV